MVVQGRYIVSHSHTINLKEVRDALQAEYPQIAFQDVDASKPQHVVDSGRVSLPACLIPMTTQSSLLTCLDGIRAATIGLDGVIKSRQEGSNQQVGSSP